MNKIGLFEIIIILMVGVWIIIFIFVTVYLDVQWKKIVNHDSRIRKLEAKKTCTYGKEKIKGGETEEGEKG